MQRYGVRDVERLLRVSRSTIRALVGAGFVTPERGPRNAWRFSFQDLIVLRTAQTLAAAQVPRRRILHALQELRRRLPEEMPLSGLSIGAVADHVVVREGARHWNAATGQYLLAFEGDPSAGTLRVFEPATRRTVESPGTVVEEGHDPLTASARAMDAYERAIAAQPDRVDARINLGHLLHEAGRLAEAEHVYRAARPDVGGHARQRKTPGQEASWHVASRVRLCAGTGFLHYGSRSRIHVPRKSWCAQRLAQAEKKHLPARQNTCRPGRLCPRHGMFGPGMELSGRLSQDMPTTGIFTATSALTLTTNISSPISPAGSGPSQA